MANPVDAARAIIINNNQLLVIRRQRPNGKQYMVTPGGRLEPGEDPEQALIRELAEETMVTVQRPQLVFIEDPNDGVWGKQYFYLCEYVSGTPRLHPESEELAAQNRGDGTYEPMWFPVEKIPDPTYPLLSERLGQEIVEAVATGFPAEVKRWTL